MRDAYGIIDHERITAVKSTQPRNMRKGALKTLQRELAKRHFSRTGSIVSGYENEPGIKNTHHTKCPLCTRSITTEPAKCGFDNCLCLPCQEKFAALPQEHREDVAAMSTAEQRKYLGVKLIKSSPLLE